MVPQQPCLTPVYLPACPQIFKKYSSSKHGKAAERLPPLKILEEAQAL